MLFWKETRILVTTFVFYKFQLSSTFLLSRLLYRCSNVPAFRLGILILGSVNTLRVYTFRGSDNHNPIKKICSFYYSFLFAHLSHYSALAVAAQLWSDMHL